MGKTWLKCWNALNYLYGTLQTGSRKRLRSYRNCHSGRCFIIGNGPSLRNSDLKRLMELGETTFACNSLIKLFNEIPFRPTYYFAQDNKIILDNKEEIAAYKGTRFLKAHYAKRYHIDGVTYYNMLFNPTGFSNNIAKVVYSGQTVTYSMIQFAAYMGFKEIYLIGVDCNYSSGNSVITQESYFDPRLFNNGRSYAPPEVDTNLLAYACARQVCDKQGVKIYNATRGGKLEIFERVSLDDILNPQKHMIMESCDNKKCCCKKILLPSIAIVAGLTLLGFFISKGLTRIANQEQYVTVKGLAEREVMSNKVVWPLPYKCVSNDMQQLYDDIEKNKGIVVAFLKEGGINDNEIIISAPAVTDRLAQSYIPDNVKFRYQAEAVITVISPQVEKVIELMGKQIELMKDGIIISDEYNYQTRFEYTALNDIKPEMVEEATRNARAVAQKFAEDSDCKLGNIRQATQGQFSITSDETTPQIKNIRVVTTVKYELK